MDAYYKNSYKSEAKPLPLSIKNVGFQRCTPDYCWGPGVRDHFLLHYVVSGTGQYSVAGNSYTVSPGQVFLIRPHVLVRYQADAALPWEYYWLGFSGPEAELLLERSEFSSERPVISIDFGEEFQEYITRIYSARGQSAGCRAQMVGYAYLLLARLCDQRRNKEDGEIAALAAEYLKNNFSNQITIADASAYAGVTRSWLYREFVRSYGQSPNAFLQQLRMEQAKELLLNTDLLISEVASSVSYADALYFSKVFSRATGLSPSQYRTGFSATDLEGLK